MIALLAATALGMEIRVPVPTTRLYDKPDRVCVRSRRFFGLQPVEMDDGRFEVSCGLDDGTPRVCMTLLLDEWPSRIAPFTCGDDPVYEIVPIPAFDPTEDIWDGVSVRRDVTIVAGSFDAGDLKEAAGLLPGGECGVIDHRFWFQAPSEPREQTCTLVLRDGSERQVPIRQVRRLPTAVP